MRKREKRVKAESHRRGTEKFGHGWASRQASKRAGHKSGRNPLKVNMK